MAEMKTLTVGGKTYTVIDEAARTAAANAQTTANSKEAAGTAASTVSAHNSSTTAHSDIRAAVSNAQSKADAAASAAASAQAAIPTKTSQLSNDSGFLTSAPVSSVNGKTGAVSLSASDVGARPDTWTPTAADVGASATGHKHTKSEITDFPTSMTPTAHNHAASEINSGTLSSDRLPTVPLTKGGTGATSASAARTALGIKSETWTFTLADGSTVTKAVYVG